MIITIGQCSRAAQTTLRRFMQLRPIPQVSSWVSCARTLQKTASIYEASILLDCIAKHYGRDVGRRTWKEFNGIDIHDRGRGCGYALDPIRTGFAPAFAQGIIYTPIDDRITRCSICDGWLPPVDLSSVRRTGLRLSGVRVSSVAFRPVAAVDETLYFINDDATLTPIYTFEEKIVGLSEGLPTGEIFVMTAPKMAPLSPDCFILSDVERQPKVTPLINIQQTLFGDCVSTGESWMTCCGGMQNAEVRFLHADGSWDTKFVHEKRVLRVALSEKGPVSIDETGQAFLWDGQQVVGDKKFALEQLPDSVRKEITSCYCGVDWTHGFVYLNSKGNNLPDAMCWRISETDVTSNAFIRQFYATRFGVSVVLLADSQFHFWDFEKNCVVAGWQLPEVCAEPDELRYLLNNRFRLSIEEDPRIRSISLD